jgi:predicted RNA methylase
MVDLEALRDRAFADAMLRMGRAKEPSIDQLREAARRSHVDLRGEIAKGLRGEALRVRFEEVPMPERDHYVEEVLGIAYPPLEEPALGRELIPYVPSGYEEIIHAFDVTKLGEGARFLDVGSGAGKVALLAALLTGATAIGVECNSALVDLAELAAAELGVSARFCRGDARAVALDEVDVVFMYLPFTGQALRDVMARLSARYFCTAALDLERYGDLVPAGPSRSWLHVYRRDLEGDDALVDRGDDVARTP